MNSALFRNVLSSCYFYCVIAIAFAKLCEADLNNDPAVSYGNSDHESYKPNERTDSSGSMLFVTTLNGQLSALDIFDNGNLQWTVDTGPGDLLSSSIQNLEINDNGQIFRIIPALSGSLYQLTAHTVEAIPTTAENLLSLSYKLSDDLVITGGKDIRSYGVYSKNGHVAYECSMAGCKNESSTGNNFEDMTEYDQALPMTSKIEDILVVRRQTQTVRAIDSRTGVERWNFSVGNNELEFTTPTEWHFNDAELDLLKDVDFRVVIPDGIVCAFSKQRNTLLWQYKFNFPIVNVWRYDTGRGKLAKVDLFQIPIESTFKDNADEMVNHKYPSIYVGIFNKQLYIQESEVMRQAYLAHVAELSHIQDTFNVPKSQSLILPWKPIPAAIDTDLSISQILTSDATEASTDTSDFSLMNPLQMKFQKGVFLFEENEYKSQKSSRYPERDPNWRNKKDRIPINSTISLDETRGIIFVSLWFWWREILVISLTSAFVLNIIWNRTTRTQIKATSLDSVITDSTQVHSSGSSTSQFLSAKSPKPNLGNEFASRFDSDFNLVQCLGQGGFGVVVEAQHKLDDCHYAVKRIILPSRQESRNRVMREVKTLANCEHPNIVRFFQAWVEQPPPGWQEEWDRYWLMDSSVISTMPGNEFSSKSTFDNALYSHSRPTGDQKTWLVVQDSKFGSIKSDESTFNDYNDDLDDSFIQFKHSSNGEEANGVNDDDNDNDLSEDESEDSLLDSINIVDKKSDRMYLYIQMQLCQKQSLKEWLVEADKTERKAKIVSIFEQIIGAVEYVHVKGLIHRDLKPSNIFFALDGSIKIGDFGLVTDMREMEEINVDHAGEMSNSSKLILKRHTQQVGTHLYMSPEQLAGLPYDYKVDIYSLGLILFELLVVFSTEMERIKILTNLRNNQFPEEYLPSYIYELDLLRLMLSNKPSERPTTFGIRARPPLNHENVNKKLYFDLPTTNGRSKVM